MEKRRKKGHWEGDTIVGSDRKSALVTHVERVSGLGIGDNVDHAKADTVNQITNEQFNVIPKNKKLTETYDNGKEFERHEELEKMTGMTIYFAYPFHSWERGCNENFNGLLREFFPKGTAFTKVSCEEVKKAFSLINNRPRKRLNYLTPREVFYSKV